ncbi:MAG: VWA domain-containing protein [Bacteroidetes bacterium]|jgi:Ca-activated chloride channel family protein|nr:VWA domain-containing protein [Bacteroidota bacterium]
MKKLYIIAILLCVGFQTNIILSQNYPKKEPPDTRILFIFDASQSMAGQWESDKKINIARKLLIKMVDSLENLDNVQLALRIYGHQSPVPPQDCDDTRLEVPFSNNNASRIRQELRFLNPKGTTPMAHSLERSANDFSKCDNCRNIVLLITDGIEACEGDPCEISRQLQSKGIILKPFVIGIGIDEHFKQSFDCIGNFYNAANEEKFEEVLGVVISQALNSTTAQVNLLDKHGKPTETNVNMTFYDQTSGKIKYNYVHTINHRGVPDTLVLDHLVKYRLKVNTIPPIEVKNISLNVGTHTIIAADTPQGTLLVKTKADDNQYRDMQFFVRKQGSHKTLNVQTIDSPEKYLVGNYQLEIPTLPILEVDNVKIDQSTTTTVEIPRPGICTVLMASPGFASLYVREENEERWIYNFSTRTRKESILLQPGNYRIVYRAANVKQSIYTISKTFEIKSGSSEVIQMY